MTYVWRYKPVNKLEYAISRKTLGFAARDASQHVFYVTLDNWNMKSLLGDISDFNIFH